MKAVHLEAKLEEMTVQLKVETKVLLKAGQMVERLGNLMVALSVGLLVGLLVEKRGMHWVGTLEIVMVASLVDLLENKKAGRMVGKLDETKAE